MIAMVFTSQIFLFVFFPLSYLCYLAAIWSQSWGKFGKWLEKLRLPDLALVGFSLLFYAWSGMLSKRPNRVLRFPTRSPSNRVRL
jgi:alginate O-acetyltransferase complex protein AlgI